jgi:hypothetical protein
MSNANPDPQTAFALFRIANGYVAAQALYVAADLGIADYLTQSALTAQELASKTGSHPDALARLLRALVAFGILNSDADDRFTLTPIGEFLRSDVGLNALGHPVFRRPVDMARVGKSATQHPHRRARV